MTPEEIAAETAKQDAALKDYWLREIEHSFDALLDSLRQLQKQHPSRSLSLTITNVEQGRLWLRAESSE